MHGPRHLEGGVTAQDESVDAQAVDERLRHRLCLHACEMFDHDRGAEWSVFRLRRGHRCWLVDVGGDDDRFDTGRAQERKTSR